MGSEKRNELSRERKKTPRNETAELMVSIVMSIKKTSPGILVAKTSPTPGNVTSLARATLDPMNAPTRSITDPPNTVTVLTIDRRSPSLTPNAARRTSTLLKREREEFTVVLR
jgi:hypothetical protein